MKKLEKDSIKEFDEWAKDYDKNKKWQFFFSNKGILDVCKPHQGSSILDVGCATGNLLYEFSLKKQDYKLFGIDISHQMIERAKNKLNSRAKIIEASADQLPYKSNMFDYVTCATSFHHYPDSQKAINEMYRVLKPNGILILLDPFTDGVLRTLFCKILDIIFQEKGTLLYKKKEMKEMFRKAGFLNIEQKTYLFYKLITIARKHPQ